jgi:hypothetical protein
MYTLGFGSRMIANALALRAEIVGDAVQVDSFGGLSHPIGQEVRSSLSGSNR